MAHPLRIEYPGAVYHVTRRGNAHADIFEDDTDRKFFLSILGQVVKRFNWICLTYCLMSNHYHLLIETPDGNLSAGMRQLNGVFTQTFNRNHGRDGHLFRGRFKAILVEKESHLLELSRYVVLNPVRAAMVKQPGEHQWNSYLAILGTQEKPEWLSTDWLLSQFSPSLGQARQQYRRFVKEGITVTSSPWDKLSGQIVLGTETFLDKLKSLLDEKEDITEIPRIQRHAGRPGLPELFPIAEAALPKAERNRLIYEAHVKHGYTLKEIFAVLNIHYTTVSKVLNQRN